MTIQADTLPIERFEQNAIRVMASLGRMWGAAWSIANAALLSTAEMLSVWAVDGVGAWLAAENLIRVLGYSRGLALLIGVALEVTGVVVIDAALAARRYNQMHPSEPPVMARLAWGVTIAQFIVTGTMIMLNAVWVDARIYSFGAIALLTTLSTIGHMIKNDVEAREKSPSPQPAPLEVAPVAEPSVAPAPQLEIELPEMVAPAQTAPLASSRDRALAFYAANPYATQEDAAKACGVNRSRIGQILKELEAEGAISRNGHVEVLEASTGGH